MKMIRVDGGLIDDAIQELLPFIEGGSDIYHAVKKVTTELVKARAELAELRKDRERLDFLFSEEQIYCAWLPKWERDDDEDLPEGYYCWNIPDGNLKWRYGPFNTPREAIDAAMNPEVRDAETD